MKIQLLTLRAFLNLSSWNPVTTILAEELDGLVTKRHQSGAFIGTVVAGQGDDIVHRKGSSLANRGCGLTNTVNTRAGDSAPIISFDHRGVLPAAVSPHAWNCRVSCGR
ncbi:hypothetical protein SCOR_26765 [Sulfidibacter corallicola]|uniref:Uncharacterized protein n=1 Tax=Sulfidibacter corallicola TaxID=2818388 RepID=A0A8A4TMR4_SULCO|nr:hypothetical protein [Sulfidibacter corallicola]QTD50843.1 hypothetical protein J3U87_00110 [Sulfidibacter corallicola]